MHARLDLLFTASVCVALMFWQCLPVFSVEGSAYLSSSGVLTFQSYLIFLLVHMSSSARLLVFDECAPLVTASPIHALSRAFPSHQLAPRHPSQLRPRR